MENLKLETLWEDADALVVNKPAGVVVNRAESIKGETVQDWTERQSWFPEGDAGELFFRRSGVAHRLDKETSGCLLIAKNPEALTSLLAQFKQRVVKKEYLALVHGRVGPKEGTVRLPLARSRFDREKWEIKYSGKMGETAWRVEKYYRELTLVRLFPKTGRTHQIRVHLAHLGYPIFADEKYLTKSLIAGDRSRLDHHFLHAAKISFKNMKGEWVSVEAPLPTDARELLSWIESE